MKKITVWYSIQNGGDGSAFLYWLLDQADAEIDQERMSEGWGEPCYGHVDTFEGSDIHDIAIVNSKSLREEIQLEMENDGDL